MEQWRCGVEANILVSSIENIHLVLVTTTKFREYIIRKQEGDTCMAKKNTGIINNFRGKIDNALQGNNPGPEIRGAVEELLNEINTIYPRNSNSVNVQEILDNVKVSNPQFKAAMDNLPEGIQYMLNNIGTHNQRYNRTDI